MTYEFNATDNSNYSIVGTYDEYGLHLNELSDDEFDCIELVDEMLYDLLTCEYNQELSEQTRDFYIELTNVTS